MKVVHALQSLETSIFLAGPTPRDKATPSWRPEAIATLEGMGYDGTIYVPEHESWSSHDNYDAQIDWEIEALNKATVIAFWVPREIVSMPAFTTNVEFGMYLRSGRALLGYPKGAPKMSYLDAVARKFGVPVVHDLDVLLSRCMHHAHELTRISCLRKTPGA